MTDRDQSGWTSLVDRYVHAFAVQYRTRYYQPENAPDAHKGLTPLDLGIFNLLDWNPNLSLKELAALLRAPSSTVTSAVNRLEKRNLLYREIHPEDRRSFRLVLTSKGEELARHRQDEKRRLFGDIYNALGDDESREEFLSLLEKIREGLPGETQLPGSGETA